MKQSAAAHVVHGATAATITIGEGLMQEPPIGGPTRTDHDSFCDATSASSSPAAPVDRLPSSGSGDNLRVPLGPVRTNGLERPYSMDQGVACIGHLVSAALFYVAAISLLLHEENEASQGVFALTQAALAIHIPCMVLLVASWVSCERIDPARDVSETLPNGWLWWKLSGPRWEKTRYCAVCRKSVPGLDHHCTWLQTCVGKSNYAQFFTIACTGTTQFVAQVLYASFCLVWLTLPFEAESATLTNIQVVLVLCLVVSVPCTVMYFVLLGFHVYLHFLGYGTYEWMLRRRREQRARMAAAGSDRKRNRDAASEARQRSPSDSTLSSVGSVSVLSRDDHQDYNAGTHSGMSPGASDREITAL